MALFFVLIMKNCAKLFGFSQGNMLGENIFAIQKKLGYANLVRV
jgi:hypothetical protein